MNCSTTVCRAIAEEANRRILPHYEGIDGFVPIVHDQGCGMSSSGDGMKNCTGRLPVMPVMPISAAR